MTTHDPFEPWTRTLMPTAAHVCAVTLNEDIAPPIFAGRPAVALKFDLGGDLDMPTILVTMDADWLRRWRDAIVGAVDTCLAELEPPAPVVRCPGCNQRLHGAIAERGACLGCYPTLPPGEIALDEVDHGE